MKKIIVILFALAVSLSTMNAQEKNLYFGPVGGMSLSSVYSKTTKVSEDYAGYFVGGMVGYKLPVLGLKANLEALYHQSGGTNFDVTRVYDPESVLLDGYVTSDISFQRLEVPVYLSFKLMELAGFELSPYVGGSFGYTFYTEADVLKERTVGTDYVETTRPLDLTDRFEYANYSALAGVDLGRSFGLFWLNIGIRYAYGVNDIGNYRDAERLSANYGAAVISLRF